MDGELLAKLLARARSEYRDSDAAGDVLDWLDEESAVLATPSAGAEAVAWLCVSPTCNSTAIVQKESHRDEFIRLGREITPLYTAPQPGAREAAFPLPAHWVMAMEKITSLSSEARTAVEREACDIRNRAAALAGPRS